MAMDRTQLQSLDDIQKSLMLCERIALYIIESTKEQGSDERARQIQEQAQKGLDALGRLVFTNID